MVVCGLTRYFTLVTPVFSPPGTEKMVQGNYLCTRIHDTGASFELIFMKFACLMRIHPWVTVTAFGNNRRNRTTNMGENVTPKPVFGFHTVRMEFFMEKTYKPYFVLHSPQKMFNSFSLSKAYFASKMIMSPKNYLSQLFWIFFF